MKKIILGIILFFLIIFPAYSKHKEKDKTYEPNYIYDQLLDEHNYEIIEYNYPAGSRELNLFGLKTVGQFNLNAVANPDFSYLAYSEVYFFPEARVTASALYLIPLEANSDKVASILSVSTKDKLQQPIIETNYANLYPFKFNTFTPVDWDSSSNKILFKEKLGQNYASIYLTKLYVYDLGEEKMYDLNLVRKTIIDYWNKKGVFLEDYKWDIVPLGFNKLNERQVVVKAFGYYKNERKDLGTWIIDVYGKRAFLYKTYSGQEITVSSNGKCLHFLPDMQDIRAKQRRINAKKYETNIVPK